MLNLSDIGFMTPVLDELTSVLQNDQGLCVIAGPKGSGKTTTLCALVDFLKDEVSSARKIVHYHIDDGSTALEAVHNTLHGALSLSTVKSPDGETALLRLMELGVDRHLVARAIRAVITQRLVRTICWNCRQSRVVTAEELQLFDAGVDADWVAFHGTGCDECSGTGSRGRLAVLEVMIISPEMRRVLMGGVWLRGELRELAIRHGMATLKQDIWIKIRLGVITVAEGRAALKAGLDMEETCDFSPRLRV